MAGPTNHQVVLSTKARKALKKLDPALRQRADEILALLPTNPITPTPDTSKLNVGVNLSGYHARLSAWDRIYWSIQHDGSVYVWQIGGHLPWSKKNWAT